MKKIRNEDLNRLSIKEYKNSKKIPVCIILDNVRSLNNIGSCFRTSDAFLIKKMYLTGFTAKPPSRDIERTALGATDSVEWEHVKKNNYSTKKRRVENNISRTNRSKH